VARFLGLCLKFFLSARFSADSSLCSRCWFCRSCLPLPLDADFRAALVSSSCSNFCSSIRAGAAVFTVPKSQVAARHAVFPATIFLVLLAPVSLPVHHLRCLVLPPPVCAAAFGSASSSFPGQQIAFNRRQFCLLVFLLAQSPVMHSPCASESVISSVLISVLEFVL
jgi:hypothetical protein